MAARKAARKPVRKKPRPAGASAARQGEPGKKHDCNMQDICAYLERLSDYLKAFNADYKAVRVALCQLEKFVYDGRPHDHAKRLCKGTGGGNEPPDPPDPPEW